MPVLAPDILPPSISRKPEAISSSFPISDPRQFNGGEGLSCPDPQPSTSTSGDIQLTKPAGSGSETTVSFLPNWKYTERVTPFHQYINECHGGRYPLVLRQLDDAMQHEVLRLGVPWTSAAPSSTFPGYTLATPLPHSSDPESLPAADERYGGHVLRYEISIGLLRVCSPVNPHPITPWKVWNYLQWGLFEGRVSGVIFE